METGPSIAQATDSDASSNGLETKLRSLEMSSSRRDDETFLSPDTGSLVSSTSDEAPDSKPATSQLVHSKKLNEYLVSANIAPITQPWMEWDKASDSTKQRYTKRTAEIVSSVLHTLGPNDPGSLWQAIVSSPAMNKALELDELPKMAKDILSLGLNRGIQPCSQLGHEKTDPVYHVRCCQLQGYLRLHTRSDKISLYFGQPASPTVWTQRSSNAPALAKDKG